MASFWKHRGQSHIEKTVEEILSLTVKTESGCMEWIGPVRPGIGRPRVNWHGQQWIATRLIVELSGISLDDDDFVCHTCDNERCVNPEHLYIGTVLDNARDRAARHVEDRTHKPTVAQMLCGTDPNALSLHKEKKK